MATCVHCGSSIIWDDYYEEWSHSNGDPQCTNPFTGELLAQWGEPKEAI